MCDIRVGESLPGSLGPSEMCIRDSAYYDDLLYHSSIRGLDVLPADDELRNLDVDLLQGIQILLQPSSTNTGTSH